MLRLCICDDKEEDIQQLRTLAQLFSEEHSEIPIQIEVFQSACDLLDCITDYGGFDLYILDVVMPKLNGIELAERIRQRGETAEILFVTVSREYAIDAFRVKSSNYILKPIQKADFDKEILSCIRNLSPKSSPYFMLKTKGGLRKVCVRELVMIESFNHSRVCTLSDGTTTETSATLFSLFEKLSMYPCFYMPHRAYIVNLDYVCGLPTLELLLSGGKRIPVSRKTYNDLKTAILNYTVQRY